MHSNKVRELASEFFKERTVTTGVSDATSKNMLAYLKMHGDALFKKSANSAFPPDVAKYAMDSKRLKTLAMAVRKVELDLRLDDNDMDGLKEYAKALKTLRDIEVDCKRIADVELSKKAQTYEYKTSYDAQKMAELTREATKKKQNCDSALKAIDQMEQLFVQIHEQIANSPSGLDNTPRRG